MKPAGPKKLWAPPLSLVGERRLPYSRARTFPPSLALTPDPRNYDVFYNATKSLCQKLMPPFPTHDCIDSLGSTFASTEQILGLSETKDKRCCRICQTKEDPDVHPDFHGMGKTNVLIENIFFLARRKQKPTCIRMS